MKFLVISMNEKLVSIVVPIYNSEKTIERCLKSILQSTYKNIEIIIVDDFSSDDSYSICIKFSHQFHNIKVYQNRENMGASYTRNIGLSHCNGFYVLFVDSDDWIEEKHISVLVDGMEKNDNNILVITGYVNDDSRFNKLITYKTFKNITTIYPLSEYIVELYDQTLLQQLWNKIFINQILIDNKIRFDETLIIGEDTRFILNYLHISKINDIYFINECYYHYMRDQENSLMFKVGYEKIEKLVTNIKLLFQLTSLSSQKQIEEVNRRKEKLMNNQAYLIFHNRSMKLREKKKLILYLENGKKLFRENCKLYYKERIVILLRNLWKKK